MSGNRLSGKLVFGQKRFRTNACFVPFSVRHWPIPDRELRAESGQLKYERYIRQLFWLDH